MEEIDIEILKNNLLNLSKFHNYMNTKFTELDYIEEKTVSNLSLWLKDRNLKLLNEIKLNKPYIDLDSTLSNSNDNSRTPRLSNLNDLSLINQINISDIIFGEFLKNLNLININQVKNINFKDEKINIQEINDINSLYEINKKKSELKKSKNSFIEKLNKNLNNINENIENSVVKKKKNSLDFIYDNQLEITENNYSPKRLKLSVLNYKKKSPSIFDITKNINEKSSWIMDSALNELFSDSNKIQNEQDLQMEIDKDFYEENNNENSNGLYFPLTIHKNEIDGNDIILEQPSKEEEVSLTPTKESYISNKLKNFESNKKLNNLINSNRKIDNISQYSKNNKNLINTDNVEINLNNNNFFNFNKKQKDSIIKINGEQNSNTNNLFLNTKSQNINLLLKDITTYKNHSEYDTKNFENLNNSITNKNLIYKEGNILNISKNYLEDNHTTNNNFFENNCENVKNSKDFNNINISLKNFLNKDKENYNYQKNICK